MKFDVVVGNPPYKKDLHLKILKVASSLLSENGEIICIHPARWMQDPLAMLKRNSDFKKYHNLPFINFEFISNEKAQKYFNNLLTSDLIISHLKNNECSILTEDMIYNVRSIPISLKKLLYLKFKSLFDVIEYNKRDGVRVKTRPIIPFIGSGAPENPQIHYYTFFDNDIFINGMANGKDWTEYGQRNQFSKPKGSPLPVSIEFNTIEEAQNFIDSTNTEVFQFFNFLTKLDVHVQLKYLPFMDDYTKPWTNERFKEYFNITDDEMLYILETMKKYI
jgi:hypothetical protein